MKNGNLPPVPIKQPKSGSKIPNVSNMNIKHPRPLEAIKISANIDDSFSAHSSQIQKDKPDNNFNNTQDKSDNSHISPTFYSFETTPTNSSAIQIPGWRNILSINPTPPNLSNTNADKNSSFRLLDDGKKENLFSDNKECFTNLPENYINSENNSETISDNNCVNTANIKEAGTLKTLSISLDPSTTIPNAQIKNQDIKSEDEDNQQDEDNQKNKNMVVLKIGKIPKIVIIVFSFGLFALLVAASILITLLILAAETIMVMMDIAVIIAVEAGITLVALVLIEKKIKKMLIQLLVLVMFAALVFALVLALSLALKKEMIIISLKNK